MARLIDAESLLNQYERIDWYSVSKKGQLMSGATTEDNAFIHYYDGEEIIKNAPTIEAVPVRHGRWEWLGPNRLVTDCMCGTCSACKIRSKYIVNTMLCPNCGAKMNGGDSNADSVD